MAARVARVAIVSAACGGLAAAATAVFAADYFLADQADLRLRAATDTLAEELNEGKKRHSRRAIERTVADENGEIATSGIRLAVFQGEQRLAGDGDAPSGAPGSCWTRRTQAGRVRACAALDGGLLLVAFHETDEARLRWWFVLAALAAVLISAAAGAASSIALTRWAVAPLTRLAAGLSRPRSDSGRVELGPASDCREVEAIRQALEQLLEQERRLLDQARRFAGDAAHELRTPLSSLRAGLELAAQDGSVESQRAALQSSVERVARLSTLVERLLVLALPKEQLAAGFETVALAEVIEEVLQRLPPERRARLELTLGEGLVRGDAELLGSLIGNALDNAFKFAAEGRVALSLTDPDAGAAEVTLRVTDTGPGVPLELRGRVFEAFFRAPGTSSSSPGHGLGLALIGHIAQVHGGHAEFAAVAQGACLSITLPAWRAISRTNLD